MSQYILQDLYNNIIDFVVYKKSIGTHPDTNVNYIDCDYVKIKCCHQINSLLFGADNVFINDANVFPQEICFYRDDEVWIFFIGHEKLLFMNNENQEDIVF